MPSNLPQNEMCLLYIYLQQAQNSLKYGSFAGIRYVDVVETLDFSIPISNDTDKYGAILVKDRGQILLCVAVCCITVTKMTCDFFFRLDHLG